MTKQQLISTIHSIKYDVSELINMIIRLDPEVHQEAATLAHDYYDALTLG